MRHRPRLSAAQRLAVIVCVVTAASLTACTHNDSKSSSSSGLSAVSGPAAVGLAVSGPAPAGGAVSGSAAAEQSAAAPAAAPEAAASAGVRNAPAPQSGQPVSVPLQSRNIVRTATLGVEVRNVNKAADQLATDAVRLGGRVDQDDRTQADPASAHPVTAQLILRILPDRLDQAMSMADGLGRETSRTVRGEDVTASVADTNARVAALQTSVRRLQALLSSSANLPDLLSLENQLTQRQASLDSTVAQQRALSDQLSLASLTVTLTEPAAVLAKTVHKPTKIASFGGALAAGWNGLLVAVRVLLAGFGYALPFAILAVALAIGALWLRRHRRSAQPQE